MEEVKDFLYGASIIQENSEAVSRAVFLSLLLPNRLPRVVIVDYGSAFKGVIKDLWKILYINYTQVVTDNQRYIRVQFCLLTQKIPGRFYRRHSNIHGMDVGDGVCHLYLERVPNLQDGPHIVVLPKYQVFPLPWNQYQGYKKFMDNPR